MPVEAIGGLMVGQLATGSVSTLYGQNSGILDGVSHGEVGMRFSYIGGLIQFGHPVTEGYKLMQVGLIDVREDDDGFDVQPTAWLRAMIENGAGLETLYPLLIEW